MTAEQIPRRLPRVKRAFAEYYQLQLGDTPTYVLFSGGQIAQMEAKKDGDAWKLTFYLTDGTKHSSSSDWALGFIREVFGAHVLGEADAPPERET